VEDERREDGRTSAATTNIRPARVTGRLQPIRVRFTQS
jgi:hypothetical protein